MYNKLNFQRALEINFIDKNKNVYKLRCPKVFAPLNIILGLWRYNGFSFWDKIKLINILRLVNKEKFPDGMLSEMTVKELLVILRQSENSIVMFWNPFIYAVFNASADNVTAFIFVNVLKIGFTKINYSNLVIPNVDLNNLLINYAIEYLQRNDVEIRKDILVEEINSELYPIFAFSVGKSSLDIIPFNLAKAESTIPIQWGLSIPIIFKFNSDCCPFFVPSIS